MSRVTWTNGQIAEMARMIQRQYGDHWEFIPESLRPCIVSHHVLGTIIGLAREDISPEDIATLRERVYNKVFPPPPAEKPEG